MTDEPNTPPVDPEETAPKSAGRRAMDQGRKAADMVDKAANVAEQTSGIFSAIKWVAIAIVMLVLFAGGFAIYKAVTVPARAVGSAVGGASEAVKAGSDKVLDSTSDVLNRLVIPVTDQAQLDQRAEAAFESLTTMAQTEPEGVKDRLARAKNFNGHDNRVCKFNLRQDDLFVPVTIAADNKAYETAKALGSKNERLIRMILMAGDTDVTLRAEWDSAAAAWMLKWKSTTLKKPVEDTIAEQRVLEVLSQAATDCQ